MQAKIDRLQVLCENSVTFTSNQHLELKLPLLQYLKERHIVLLNPPQVHQDLITAVLKHGTVAECRVNYRGLLLIRSMGYCVEDALDRVLEIIEKMAVRT